MPGEITEITELATGLGLVAPDLNAGFARRPDELGNVDDAVWARLQSSFASGAQRETFETAFANGAALLHASDGLRGRPPLIIEWRGPHRTPGDDVIPADLRIDHVYLVSCKYLSRVLLNVGPARLFDRLLVGEERSSQNWFQTVAPGEFEAFYREAKSVIDVDGLPFEPSRLTVSDQNLIRDALSSRVLPAELQPYWAELCEAVSVQTARRWRANLASDRTRLRTLWRLLRISDATYFVLGTDRSAHLRLRVNSTWDWHQRFTLAEFEVDSRNAGQPEVSWHAHVRERASGASHAIDGHVEIRWSHGRFRGAPEAKVYLDTSHSLVPGYDALGE